MTDTSAVDRDFDPIQFSVIRSSLVAVSREMGVTLRQTAYSDIFNEGNDFSCGLFDAKARLTAQGEFLPIHLGALQYAVRQAIEELAPLQEFRPGDAIISNDPYRGGTHLPDLTMVSPIFYDGELVAFAANRAHHADVGGAVPGSFYSRAKDNFMEGLRIPPVWLYRAGERQRDVYEFILNNVRVPANMKGDLAAQVSANRSAALRYQALCKRYGRATIASAEERSRADSEARMRAVIRSWPDGEYFGEDIMDNDGITDEPIAIRVKVVVNGDALVIDYSDTDPQASGPINSVPYMTASATYLCLQAATDPEIAPNHGCYRPIKIVTREGTLVHPIFPAPCTAGNETSHRIVNALMAALSTMPNGPHVIAGDQGSSNNMLLTCYGKAGMQILYQYPEGAWGATPEKDGESALFSIVGNCLNMPAEALELKFPIRLKRYELRADSGGDGKFRGGLGTRRDYEILSDVAELSFVADRCKFGAMGFNGGGEGAPGAYLIDRGDGFQPASPNFASKGAEIPLRKGDVVSQQTAGGGGWGDPAERCELRRNQDLEAGYVTRSKSQDNLMEAKLITSHNT